MDEILYPVQQIPKFEKQNGISINLYGYDDGEIFPLCISKFEHAIEIDLVMFLVLHPMESISLNSFVLLEHLAMLLTSTHAINC